ncbi:cytochrome c3 family protein [Campylobacter suis]|uniref:Tetrahaem cytochrome domain-containing protein n=1 Tax=Campylobacter suis TaxID=2790657 RepID=A0ABM8Q2L8_9BACT|nr:cytochrome c3 family protein [Campylobacter suis]CAD7287076.1 hypothetical protein LMG8286_00707 [Campylobacter suis]
MRKFLALISFLTLSLFAYDTSLMDVLRNSKGEVTKNFSKESFPLQGIHQKLGLDCKDCHKENDQKDYSSAMNASCMQCHVSYEKLAERTGVLGHTDNIHANPHYESLDCDTCHSTHKPTVNMCVRCHTQDSLKSLIVK